MAKGIGGLTTEQALAQLDDMTANVRPIAVDEYQRRIDKALGLMAKQQSDVMLLNAGTNLRYFTGVDWYASERLVAALLFADGSLIYVIPHFEIGSIAPLMLIKGEVLSWQEHDDPYALCAQRIKERFGEKAKLALDESAQFFIADGLQQHLPNLRISNARQVTAPCRMHKSAAELALMQTAMNMTLAVHKAAASILYDGISTTEVTEFIHLAHKKVGAASGSYFCIVLFGEDTAYPHGVAHPKTLSDNDMVLIDTGCRVHGYLSDITRSYVFGKANERQRTVWQHEKHAQQAAFAAARNGIACQQVDRAARGYLQQQGYGPDYNLPGLPHRTGHGIGLDIHEWPYLVEGDTTELATGMCFSNEPMLVLPGEFGVRLEDHFYMTEQGPRWFTEPAVDIEQPFG
ncbi:MAG: X-Pro dipeptidase [Alteromonadaceae bacterium]|jgi:Xaa-Pro dipeptidase|uniref:M24 family metallopeptidase n=1 Tax=Rheinheimera aquimaris TaxID=412437 RepID=UPI000C69D20E|nr:Xaa-Pro peptidase family protein [Rheinheimera aquimaris]MBJ91128.1 X-Pro dipeptidase [Alteromonadaceae bacterium]HBN88784.1 X-Pro dipeptidase [Rheinheimera sp.]|tara:strand:+ start:2095 stop:3303 length:1209 start_codon:yes stop_codon:yes gene_type:complete